MTVRLTLALLCAALFTLAAGCGGSTVTHDASKGDVPRSGTLHVSISGVAKAGLRSTIYFIAEVSSDEGDITGVEWNFDDGTGWHRPELRRTHIMPHVFETKGNYKVIVRGIDAVGNTGSDSMQVQIKDKYDADPVFIVLGPFESDSIEQNSGGRFRYHHWEWTTLSYDPEDPDYGSNPILDINRQLPTGAPGTHVCHNEGDPAVDFCGIDLDRDGTGDDLDDDGTDDDPSMKRTLVFPHCLEVSGRCLGKSKEDVYVWKIKTVGANGEGRKEYVGHVSLLK